MKQSPRLSFVVCLSVCLSVPHQISKTKTGAKFRHFTNAIVLWSHIF